MYKGASRSYNRGLAKKAMNSPRGKVRVKSKHTLKRQAKRRVQKAKALASFRETALYAVRDPLIVSARERRERAKRSRIKLQT